MHSIAAQERFQDNQKSLIYLNPLCSLRCINNSIDGKLLCNCADTGIYNWTWASANNDCVVLLKNNTEVIFHPIYSAGTAALKGTRSLQKNMHHFWEIKMLSSLYGTDIMVGVGTSDAYSLGGCDEFVSLLGSNEFSWGYSYQGSIQHNNIVNTTYGPLFGLGSLIGVHLDMYAGTLEFYLNRKPLGIAFRNLKNKELYPMICSTAAHSSMKLTFARTLEKSLKFMCLQTVIKNPDLFKQFETIPGLARMHKNDFLLLPRKINI